MTVKELYNWCKRQKDKEAKVYMVKDWEQCDEEGFLTDLYELEDICTQRLTVDAGLGWKDITEVLLAFKEEKATYEINH